ncbi:MAG: peptidylprolyl isomerase [Planctomycetota bacterium]|jgi:parvulin-like peptidyl-prolyl isomerase
MSGVHRILVSACLTLVAAGGCAVPLHSLGTANSSNDAEPEGSPAQTNAPAPSMAPANAGENGPVYELRVGTETVTAADLWKGEYDKFAENRAKGEAAFQRFVLTRSRQLISDKITEMLLYQHTAARMPEQANDQVDKYIDGEIRRIITAQHGGVQRRFEKSLQLRGSTLDDYRASRRRETIIGGFLEQEIRPKVAEPTRLQLLALFEASKDRWRRPERRQMSLIEFRFSQYFPQGTRNPSDDQATRSRAKARTAARVVLEEIKMGASFAEQARKHSHGVRAIDGGSWGWVKREDVRERYLLAIDALQTLQQGQVSALIEVDDAVFLVRCDEIEHAHEPSFTEVQPELKDEHFRRTYNEIVAELVDGLRRQSRIDPPNLDRFYAGMVEVAVGDDFPPKIDK